MPLPTPRFIGRTGIGVKPVAGWEGTGDVLLENAAISSSWKPFLSSDADPTKQPFVFRIAHKTIAQEEIATGIYTHTPQPKLTRDQVILSTSGGAKVSFTAGDMEVTVVATIEEMQGFWQEVSDALDAVSPAETTLNNPAGPVSFDLSVARNLTIYNLAHDLGINAANYTAGMRGSLVIEQDGVGGRSITWGTGFDSSTFSNVALQDGPGEKTAISYIVATIDGVAALLPESATGSADDTGIESTHTPTNFSFGAGGATVLGAEQGIDTALGTRYTPGAALNMADAELSRPLLRDYAETVVPVTVSSGIAACDMELGNVFRITLTGNVTVPPVPTHPPASGREGTATLRFVQDGTGGRTVSWAGANITWLWSGLPPTIDPTAGSTSLVTLSTDDGGVTWLGVGDADVMPRDFTEVMALLRPSRTGTLNNTTHSAIVAADDGKILRLTATATITATGLPPGFSCTIRNNSGSGVTGTITLPTGSQTLNAGEQATLSVDDIGYHGWSKGPMA